MLIFVGGVYCYECSLNLSLIVPLGYLEQVRVFDVCIDYGMSFQMDSNQAVTTLNESSESDVSLYSSLELVYKQQLMIKTPKTKLSNSLSFTNTSGFIGGT